MHILFAVSSINQTLMMCVFINILLLVLRNSSKLSQGHRNEKSLRTTAIDHRLLTLQTKLFAILTLMRLQTLFQHENQYSFAYSLLHSCKRHLLATTHIGTSLQQLGQSTVAHIISASCSAAQLFAFRPHKIARVTGRFCEPVLQVT